MNKEDIIAVRRGRTTIGERRGKDVRTRSFSQRAFDGRLSVEQNGPCPKCGHNKYFSYVSRAKKKCTRCGAWYA